MKIVLILHTKERVSENQCHKDLTMYLMRKTAFGRLLSEGIEPWQRTPKKPQQARESNNSSPVSKEVLIPFPFSPPSSQHTW